MAIPTHSELDFGLGSDLEMLRDTVRPHVVDHLNRIMAIHHGMMGMQPPAQPAR